MLQFCNMKHNIARYSTRSAQSEGPLVVGFPGPSVVFLTWCAEHSPGILLQGWVADLPMFEVVAKRAVLPRPLGWQGQGQ